MLATTESAASCAASSRLPLAPPPRATRRCAAAPLRLSTIGAPGRDRRSRSSERRPRPRPREEEEELGTARRGVRGRGGVVEGSSWRRVSEVCRWKCLGSVSEASHLPDAEQEEAAAAAAEKEEEQPSAALSKKIYSLSPNRRLGRFSSRSAQRPVTTQAARYRIFTIRFPNRTTTPSRLFEASRQLLHAI